MLMKLLLVDDHPLFALSFAQALTQADAGIHVDAALILDDGLSRTAYSAQAARAIGAGASGYLGKPQSIDQLLAALRSMARGEQVFVLAATGMPAPRNLWPSAR